MLRPFPGLRGNGHRLDIASPSRAKTGLLRGRFAFSFLDGRRRALRAVSVDNGSDCIRRQMALATIKVPPPEPGREDAVGLACFTVQVKPCIPT